MTDDLLKIIATQELLIGELLAESEELRCEIGSTLVDLREENELIRRDFSEFKVLSARLIDYNYDSEATHYDETIDEDGEGGEDHIFHTINKLKKVL